MLSISIISYLRSWNWKLTFSNIQTSAVRSFKARFWNTCLMTAFMVAPVCRHRDSSVGNFSGLICHSFSWEQPPAVSAPLPFLHRTWTWSCRSWKWIGLLTTLLLNKERTLQRWEKVHEQTSGCSCSLVYYLGKFPRHTAQDLSLQIWNA